MSSWIAQAGHPILHVEVDYKNDVVVLTQVKLIPAIKLNVITKYFYIHDHIPKY